MVQDEKVKRRTGDEIEIPGDYQYRAITEGFSVQKFWHQSKLTLIERLDFVTPNTVALDCGCGSGVVANYVAQTAKEVVGVDGNTRAIEFASKQFQRDNLKFVNSLVEDIPYPKEYFNSILCMEVLEHLYEPQARALVKTFNSLCAPGGLVMLTTPNYRGLWPVIETLADKSGKVAHMDESQHVNRYTAKKLRLELEDAGFQVLKLGTFSTFAPFAAAVNWKLAQGIERLEGNVNLPFGNLLYVLARKP
jgi:2-polyprenyl-6-hydroxyphenyl methylase/3-demethylubiquinone-9 3-methyltransferase